MEKFLVDDYTIFNKSGFQQILCQEIIKFKFSKKFTIKNKNVTIKLNNKFKKKNTSLRTLLYRF